MQTAGNSQPVQYISMACGQGYGLNQTKFYHEQCPGLVQAGNMPGDEYRVPCECKDCEHWRPGHGRQPARPRKVDVQVDGRRTKHRDPE